MESQVVIEPAANDGHLVDIQNLAHAIWHEHYPGIISTAQIDYMLREGYGLETLRREIAQGAIRYERALLDGALIGFSAFEPSSDEGSLILHKLYVDAAQRDRGCGRKLVESASACARAQSLRRIVLRVNKRNRVAIEAYERMGFENRGSVVTDIGGGFQMDDYRMQLEL